MTSGTSVGGGASSSSYASDDHAGGLIETLYALPCGIGVGNVVVRERLALQLTIGAEAAGCGLEVPVERSFLVGVLAIAKRLGQIEVQIEPFRKTAWFVLGSDRRKVVADGAIVRRGMRKRLPRKAKSSLTPHGPFRRRHLVQQ